MLPKIIENGYIYIAQPPLFRVKRGKSETYIKNERGLEDYLIRRSVSGRVVRVWPRAAAERRAVVADLHRLLSAGGEGPHQHVDIWERLTFSDI